MENEELHPSPNALAWTLFKSFFKIGLFTFGGGFAMIPLIQKEIIERRGWIEKQQFLELLTLAQTAPGPIALNTSVFVGYRIAGYRGAAASTLGVIIPSFVLILFIAIYFKDIKDNRVVEAMFKGMRPAVVALIVAPMFSLSKGMGVYRIVLALVAGAAVWRCGVSPIWLIIVGAGAGIAYAWYKSKSKKS